MTDTPELLPKRQKAKRVLFVAFPDVGLLDLTGAQTVFWAATKAMEARGLKGYERCTASMAGGLVRSEIENADPEGLLQDIDIKVVGYMRFAKAAAAHMRKGGYGRIINIGGLTGRGSKQLSGMRNVAIAHMTKTLSDQLGPSGITVNVIHPGVVETPPGDLG